MADILKRWITKSNIKSAYNKYPVIITPKEYRNSLKYKKMMEAKRNEQNQKGRKSRYICS